MKQRKFEISEMWISGVRNDGMDPSVFYCSMMCDQLRAICGSESRSARWKRRCGDWHQGMDIRRKLEPGTHFRLQTSQHNNTRHKPQTIHFSWMERAYMTCDMCARGLPYWTFRRRDVKLLYVRLWELTISAEYVSQKRYLKWGKKVCFTNLTDCGVDDK